MVSLVKQNLNCTTLAIGDGANDVSMIQAADVGIGIIGHEGLQAARSSDYAIGQFKLFSFRPSLWILEKTSFSWRETKPNQTKPNIRFLKKLLLVHGHLSYRRLSKLILYSFYKTLTLYLVSFYYSFQNGFSGQLPWDLISNVLWNVAYTFLGIIFLGVFEQDVSQNYLMDFPPLYKAGQRNDFVKILTSPLFNFLAFLAHPSWFLFPVLFDCILWMVLQFNISFAGTFLSLAPFFPSLFLLYFRLNLSFSVFAIRLFSCWSKWSSLTMKSFLKDTTKTFIREERCCFFVYF